MSRLDWLTARPIAHRGYHDSRAGCVENTLPAAAAAIERGFGIECDLRLGADGAVVVFHDETLDRLTFETGAIRHKTLDELKAARFRDGEARIPTLEALLDVIDGRVPLLAELKSDWSGVRDLEVAAAHILAEYVGPVAVLSFDPASMAAMRRLAPALPRGLITDGFARDRWPSLSAATRVFNRALLSAPRVLPSFVACGIAARPGMAPLILRHVLGLPVLAWTVASEADRAVVSRWADQIVFEGFDPGD